MIASCVSVIRGSSPRVWGTPPSGPVNVNVKGLIPTGVGNTSSGVGNCRCPGAHPHGRGEHGTSSTYSPLESGSSPRVWGTRPTFFWDVPTMGSSPRVWGTHRGFYRFGRYRGLILTGVGNTTRGSSNRSPDSAHPHGCGEHLSCSTVENFHLGSSPRVWGTRIAFDDGDVLPRLIPTGVGNTTGPTCPRLSFPAHPHGCGEHEGYNQRPLRSAGSSPRVWGTPTFQRVDRVHVGLIPTGVGNTSSFSTRPCCQSAHPHGCGEHNTVVSTVRLFAGSSPRVWGTLVKLA